MTALLEVEHLVKQFRLPAGRVVHAVDDVSFSIAPGETFGLVGESGSGKSTVARLVMRLLEPTAGTIRFDGIDITRVSRRKLRPLRGRFQIVFQDPYSSLDPKMTGAEIVAEPLPGRRRATSRRVDELFELVGLRRGLQGAYANELSGGQRQRIAIARALAAQPALVVLDEPLTALDASVQAQILNLLVDLQHELGVAYLFISHDLAVVQHLADRIAVMYLGRLMETGPTKALLAEPGHPYTQALLSAVPVPDPARERRRRRIVLRGDAPAAQRPPSGCVFRTRCWRAEPECAQTVPDLVERGGGHPVACLFPDVPDDGAAVPD